MFFFPNEHNITKIGLYVVPGIVHVGAKFVGAKFVGGKELLVTQLFCARKQDVKNTKKFLNQTDMYMYMYIHIYM